MDLGAYAQIEDLNHIMKENGIDIPRLRGLRLMSKEIPLDYEKQCDGLESTCVEQLCHAMPFWNPNSWASQFDYYTNMKEKYYCPDGNVRWDRIHGWKRRVLKTYIHNWKREIREWCETFNKYIGREDVIYIHARIGGGNWPYYKESVLGKPWFIEKIDDPYDCTYCDIYAKINER